MVHGLLLSRRKTPELLIELSAPGETRAQGKPGARCTRSLVCKSEKHTSKSPQVHRIVPAFPARMVLTVSFALAPETGLYCLRRQRNAHALSPAWYQRRDIRPTRLRRPLLVRSSAAPKASIASRTQRSWRSRSAPL